MVRAKKCRAVLIINGGFSTCARHSDDSAHVKAPYCLVHAQHFAAGDRFDRYGNRIITEVHISKD